MYEEKVWGSRTSTRIIREHRTEKPVGQTENNKLSKTLDL